MGRLQHRTAPGFTYFVTTKTWQNRSIFQVSANADILIDCMFRHRDQGTYRLHEFVIMPDHVHLMLTPSNDASLEKAMQFIKGASSHDIRKLRSLNMQVWQPGFHEESVRDCDDYGAKALYIRMNPVRARLIERPEEWPCGSASGRFHMDDVPQRLKVLSSGAKAPLVESAGMSELKLRPPKVPELKDETVLEVSPSPALGAENRSEAKPGPALENEAASETKPSKELRSQAASSMLARPRKNLS